MLTSFPKSFALSHCGQSVRAPDKTPNHAAAKWARGPLNFPPRALPFRQILLAAKLQN